MSDEIKLETIPAKCMLVLVLVMIILGIWGFWDLSDTYVYPWAQSYFNDSARIDCLEAGEHEWKRTLLEPPTERGLYECFAGGAARTVTLGPLATAMKSRWWRKWHGLMKEK